MRNREALRAVLVVWSVGLVLVALMIGCEHKPPSGGGSGESQNFEIQIETTHNTLQGMHVIVDVTLNSGYYRPTGFDLKLVYNAQALCFMAAIPGDLHVACDWEYFNYRYEQTDDDLPAGHATLRVTALADCSGRSHYEDSGCEIDVMNSGPLALFSLDFVVTNDWAYEGTFWSLMFVWEDCDDNIITYRTRRDPSTDFTAVSRRVWDDPAGVELTNERTGFPTYAGCQQECWERTSYGVSGPSQLIDFHNGGVDIIGHGDIDVRGDVNLNGTPFELADAVLFSDYFREGLEVFTINQAAQIEATDVNGDGVPLTTSDLVYLIQIIVGGALPYPLPEADSARCSIVDGVLSVDQEVAAAQVVLEGEVDWTLLADHTTSTSRFDGGRTYVLILAWRNPEENPWSRYTFSGPFFQTEGEVIAIEMSTPDGARVDVEIEAP